MYLTPRQSHYCTITNHNNQLQCTPTTAVQAAAALLPETKEQKTVPPRHSQVTEPMKHHSMPRGKHPNQNHPPHKPGSTTYQKQGLSATALIEHEDGSTQSAPKVYRPGMAWLVEHACTSDRDERSGKVTRSNRQHDTGKAGQQEQRQAQKGSTA